MPSDARDILDDFAQLALLVLDPIQGNYEEIRPMVFGVDTVAERSDATGIDRRTLSDKAQRFVERGMLGLQDQRTTQAGRKPHQFPEPVAQYILYLKHLYSPIRYREIVRIIERKYGYQTNHHTVKRFLAQHPIPVQLPMEWTFYHQFDDAYRARWTVVRMFYEGWHGRSIAGCLHLSERHVRRIIAAFKHDGFAGLEDQRTRPVHHPHNQLTLPLLKEILDVQKAYPRAGRFRVWGIVTAQQDGNGPSQTTTSDGDQSCPSRCTRSLGQCCCRPNRSRRTERFPLSFVLSSSLLVYRHSVCAET